MADRFAPLQRKAQQLSEERCIALLKTETRGVLSVAGDNGYPYGMPMNHFYNQEDGCLYFHCGKSGHRLRALKGEDKVSFCVYDRGEKSDDDWALKVCSVIVFGRIEIVDDAAAAADICRLLSLKFTDDLSYIQREIDSSLQNTLLLKLVPLHICGKTVLEK